MRNTPLFLPVKSTLLLVVMIGLLLTSCKKLDEADRNLESPNGKIKLAVGESSDGGIYYSIRYDKKEVIEKSDLGLLLDQGEFFKTLKLNKASEVVVVKDKYTLLHGKRRENNYTANQKTYYCLNKEGKKLNIIFNVSNEGVAFRYHFPDSSNSISKILEEKTSFQFPKKTVAWLQPMSEAKSGWNKSNPSYEEYYKMEVPAGTPSPTKAGWVFPALFKVDSTWVLVTESGLQKNYCGSRLRQESSGGKYELGFPQQLETIFGGPVNPESTLPWSSPWRVIAVGSLANIVESSLGTDVAVPAENTNLSYIKPGLASWSWALLKDESITYDIQKQFVDYASKMHWPYCLVDVNWDTTIGYDGIKKLSAYARSKGVALILWYNSAGDWNTVPFHPKDKLLNHDSRDKEFSILQEMRIGGVKIDFFGGDGQSVIAYYQDILKDAAQHQLLVNFHGATLPRGWQRTYPNLMTMESIKGFEFITFEQANADQAPTHCALLPFCRNAFDPMDFTPMCLDSIPKITRRTSPAFELALPVLFLSGIQHIAETPKGMSHVPLYVKNYLIDLPTDWDDTKFIDGYPGHYAVIARRKGSQWYIAGINATHEELNLKLNLSFIGRKEGTLIHDGKNKSHFTTIDLTLHNDSTINLNLASKGGFVMRFD